MSKTAKLESNDQPGDMFLDVPEAFGLGPAALGTLLSTVAVEFRRKKEDYSMDLVYSVMAPMRDGYTLRCSSITLRYN